MSTTTDTSAPGSASAMANPASRNGFTAYTCTTSRPARSPVLRSFTRTASSSATASRHSQVVHPSPCPKWNAGSTPRSS
ncbi:hypothetical protein [Saccharopolyspora spinosa]|uniref:hypothetical protein n=1 Tax=Saccharopolyspora spinosa TaxID=60894 RepID=UPI000237B682